jgi:hypothetical protein
LEKEAVNEEGKQEVREPLYLVYLHPDWPNSYIHYLMVP